MSPPSYIRLQPSSFSVLPDHPSLTQMPTRPPLRDFLHEILTEAQSFVSAIPTTFHPTHKPRRSPPAAAPVLLSTCSLPKACSGTGPKKAKKQQQQQQRGSEFWICRTSVHENAARDGTASSAEFRAGLRENHSAHEMEYTPSVTAVETLLEWPLQSVVEGGWQRVETHGELSRLPCCCNLPGCKRRLSQRSPRLNLLTEIATSKCYYPYLPSEDSHRPAHLHRSCRLRGPTERSERLCYRANPTVFDCGAGRDPVRLSLCCHGRPAPKCDTCRVRECRTGAVHFFRDGHRRCYLDNGHHL